MRKRIDDVAYQTRFTTRKKASIWSAINIAKVPSLIKAGRMQTPGLEAFGHRKEHRSVVYAYEQGHAAELAAHETKLFKQNKPAWAYFEACPPSYRQRVLHLAPARSTKVEHSQIKLVRPGTVWIRHCPRAHQDSIPRYTGTPTAMPSSLSLAYREIAGQGA